jgi:hypothetical protein
MHKIYKTIKKMSDSKVIVYEKLKTEFEKIAELPKCLAEEVLRSILDDNDLRKSLIKFTNENPKIDEVFIKVISKVLSTEEKELL